MTNVITGDKEFFKGIGQVKFEGVDTFTRRKLSDW